MSSSFKWHMFFTSFLPLWASIIVSDLWSVITGICELIKSATENIFAEFGIQLIKRCILDLNLQIISILLLLVHIIISIKYINREISTQQRSSNREKGTIIKCKRANKLSAEFLLAYILPLIAFDFVSIKDIVQFLIYFAVLSFLCIRNNNVYTNIFLEFKGYRMFECNVECIVMGEKQLYKDCLVISRGKLTNPLPRDLFFFDYDKHIYIDLGGNNE